MNKNNKATADYHSAKIRPLVEEIQSSSRKLHALEKSIKASREKLSFHLNQFDLANSKIEMEKEGENKTKEFLDEFDQIMDFALFTEAFPLAVSLAAPIVEKSEFISFIVPAPVDGSFSEIILKTDKGCAVFIENEEFKIVSVDIREKGKGLYYL